MSVRVFVAANAREGLARVRKELGDDAVVLSTRPHPQGVELLASAYGDLAVPASEAAETAGSSRILAELSRLRGLLQNQLAGFAWGTARRRDPVRVALMQTLFAAGFGSVLARTLAARLPRLGKGVDIVVDDTPEAVTLSSFDPVRREVARIALTKMIQDGRIHPTRIEKLVEDAEAEVERVVKEEGERVSIEAGVPVLPIAVNGTGAGMPKGSPWVRPCGSFRTLAPLPQDTEPPADIFSPDRGHCAR